jgi:hypothetical protein
MQEEHNMTEKDVSAELNRFLELWEDSGKGTKRAFLSLKDHLCSMPNVRLSFHARPGITYSLRASNPVHHDRELFVMTDVIDDEPENRWLSVCFYEEMITDPEERGDVVPQGLLGKDGYCFVV